MDKKPKSKPKPDPNPHVEPKPLKDIVTTEYDKGNVVFATVDGFAIANIDEFIKQPVDGILYDLNRDELTVLTWIDEPKWVNDYAVCKVIRKLKDTIETLENTIHPK